jgi:hypothetical protein
MGFFEWEGYVLGVEQLVLPSQLCPLSCPEGKLKQLGFQTLDWGIETFCYPPEVSAALGKSVSSLAVLGSLYLLVLAMTIYNGV